jgi:hypothetical protein
VVVGFREELHTTGLSEGVKRTDNLRAVAFKLFEQRAGNTIGDPESAFVFSYQIENEPISRQVAFVGYLAADGGVLVFVEIVAALIKDGIVSQPQWLMYLKVEYY